MTAIDQGDTDQRRGGVDSCYVATLTELTQTTTADVLVRLAELDRRRYKQLSHDQLRAWEDQLSILKGLAEFIPQRLHDDITVVLEYTLPRSTKRVDAVLLYRQLVLVVEFKVGSRYANRADAGQLADYALDLAYYHAASADKAIVPILCATELTQPQILHYSSHSAIEKISAVGKLHFGSFIAEQLLPYETTRPSIASDWIRSQYQPIPGVIEAAVQLFSSHEVSDLKATLASQSTIESTIDFVHSIVLDAMTNGKKVLCLLTGVPGSGKTLTGLQIAHHESLANLDCKAAFLSGNGPLLQVLQAALASDYASRANSDGGKQRVSKDQARAFAKTLLNSVHLFIEDASKSATPPKDRVIIFDEAQRAWDAQKITKSLRKSSSQENDATIEPKSEPRKILEILDGHSGGAVVIALCGTGQEIHDGEAGVQEWIATRASNFPHWSLIASDHAVDTSAGHLNQVDMQLSSKLHLNVSVRSHRAEKHAAWVDAVLAGDAETAKAFIDQAAFPITQTRDLDEARKWLRANCMGQRRSGLLASSSAARLRPYGVEVSAGFRKEIDWPQWFTAPAENFRSSMSLEVAATEFECQGLELDKVCVCWGWELLISPGFVEPRKLASMQWRVKMSDREREYRINKFRVLLTRAREGMVIWIPRGEDGDATRPSAETDRLSAFLLSAGVVQI